MRSIEQHYEETLPAETEAMKECERLMAATEARIADMQYKAMLQGHVLKFHWDGKGHADLFMEPDLPKHPDAPKIKMSQYLENARMIREFRQAQQQSSSKPIKDG